MAKIKLTRGERLKGLRVEKGFTLAERAGATKIPPSTLNRLANKDDCRAGHPDITILVKLYGVSATIFST